MGSSKGLIIVVSMFPRELISPSASLYEFPTAIHSEEGKDNIQQVDCVCACVCEREKERERERKRDYHIYYLMLRLHYSLNMGII